MESFGFSIGQPTIYYLYTAKTSELRQEPHL